MASASARRLFATISRTAAALGRPGVALATAASLGGGAAFLDGSAYVYDSGRAASSQTSSSSSSSSAAAAAAALATAPALPHAPQPRVIFVLGGPGAGKGTQCALLVKEFDFVHLSAGDLLREERDSGSPDGAMITQFINEGKIVPVEVTIELIKKAMRKSGATKFLVDGFPRNYDNLDGWFRVMGAGADAHAVVEGVLQFDVGEDVLVQRLLKRGETSGRSDDNIAAIQKRLRTYNDSTVAVVKHFEAEGKVTRIFGGDPVDVVFAKTAAAVAPVVRSEVLAYNQLLLDAIGALDWAAYDALVADDVTCFEPEAAGLVRGKQLHKDVFEQTRKARRIAGNSRATKTTMEGAEVTMLGTRSALVKYVRVGGSRPYAESRVWTLGEGGRWRMQHFHRSPDAPPAQ